MKFLIFSLIFTYSSSVLAQEKPVTYRLNDHSLSHSSQDPSIKRKINYNLVNSYLGIKKYKKKYQTKIRNKEVIKNLFSIKQKKARKKEDKAYSDLTQTDYQYLAWKRSQFVPSAQNTFPFVNAYHEFENNPLVGDYEHICTGVATLLRHFSFLAFFDPNPQADPHLPNLETNYWSWVSYHLQKIDQLLEGNAVLFAGFHNIRELTQIPEIEEYLKLRSIDLWASRALDTDNKKNAKKKKMNKGMKAQEYQGFLAQVKKKIDYSELPLLFVGNNINSAGLMFTQKIHALVLLNYEQYQDRLIVDYYDINFYGRYQENYSFKLHLLHDGRMYMESWVDDDDWEYKKKLYAKELGQGKGVPVEMEILQRAWFPRTGDHDTAKFSKSIQAFCQGNAEYCQ
ncbi:MAG: hypothetical protein H6620_12595 [Halobacteriovoraceae bacterium]|nr:hypothetical protein [Halobacteriovoraceae bacterium]